MSSEFFTCFLQKIDGFLCHFFFRRSRPCITLLIGVSCEEKSKFYEYAKFFKVSQKIIDLKSVKAEDTDLELNSEGKTHLYCPLKGINGIINIFNQLILWKRT